MTVHFENVGRFKQSWSVEVPALSEHILEASVRKHGKLASHDIEVWFNEDGTGGRVVVGGMRPVGTFRIEGGVAMRVRLA